MYEQVGFIGLGTMGLPMAQNLARAGVRLTLYDANPAVLAGAATLAGAIVASSVAEVASTAEVVFTCLPNDEIVGAIYLGAVGIAAAARPGLVTCDCSTVSPEVTLQVGASVKAKGAHHMDTPMLGSQPQAVAGEIFFIVGGEHAQLARIKPYLEIMGKLHMYVGSSGMGNRVKLLANGLAAATSVAVAETLAVCVQSGVDPLTFCEVMRSGNGMGYGNYFERRAKRIIDGEFAPAFMLELMRKDARMALALAQSAKVPTPVLAEAKHTYDEAVEAGWGREDFSAVTHVIEKRIGRKLSAN